MINSGTGDAAYYASAGGEEYIFGVDNSLLANAFVLGRGQDLATDPLFSWENGTNRSYQDLSLEDIYSLINTLNISMTGTLEGNGVANLSNFDTITANSKSFDIAHPTKEGWRLRYGNLEGPEHGVYHRGQTTSHVIELPDYWTGLVHQEGWSVQLTPIGGPCVHWVEKIEDNKVYINCQDGKPNCYYTIFAERKDVEKVLLEYKPIKG